MARGKYLSLDEARKAGRLEQFAREHQIPLEDQHPRARVRFERLLDLVCQGTKPDKRSRKAKVEKEGK